MPCPPITQHTGRLLSGLLALMLVLVGGPAAAQAATRVRTPEPSAQPSDSALAWSRLSERQKAALQPLAPVWNQIGPNRKRKWIALSADFDRLTPAEQTTLHGRMREWAALSNAERNRARLNFAEIRSLSVDERKAQWEAYQALSPAQKEQLARQAGSRPTVGAAPAITQRSTGKLAAVPVTRSDAASAAARSPTKPASAAPDPTVTATPTTSP
ncbi:DUF3106 domain-containing protein [Comamonadaceae bacterium G21597-S1]|nr:DUF3106 domain-containing protein [Comamonadaceae bacterium G21597-S1]